MQILGGGGAAKIALDMSRINVQEGSCLPCEGSHPSGFETIFADCIFSSGEDRIVTGRWLFVLCMRNPISHACGAATLEASA